MPSRRDLKLMLLVAALFLGLADAVLVAGLSADVLLFAPLFVLLVPLLGGRYVGEEQLDRLRCAYAARRRRPRVAVAVPALRRPAFVLGRGGRLAAGASFCRPPPAHVTTAF